MPELDVERGRPGAGMPERPGVGSPETRPLEGVVDIEQTGEQTTQGPLPTRAHSTKKEKEPSDE